MPHIKENIPNYGAMKEIMLQSYANRNGIGKGHANYKVALSILTYVSLVKLYDTRFEESLIKKWKSK